MSCDIFNKVSSFKCSKDSITNYDTKLASEFFKTDDDYINTPYNEKYKINYILDNKKDYPYKLCNIKNNERVINCSLKKKHPWYTLSSDKTKCSLPDNIELPPNFEIKENKLIFNNTDDIAWFQKTRFYEKRWYDWFLIPNYHFGNDYYQHTTTNGNNIKVYGNYKPCENNFIPYGTVSNIDKIYNKCVSKDYAYNGLFSKELQFSPLAFLVLLGGNIYDYNLLYTQNLIKKINKIDFNKYELKENKYEKFKNSSNIFHYTNIFNDTTNNNFLYDITDFPSVFEDLKALKTFSDSIDKDIIIINDEVNELKNTNILKKNLTFKSSYSNIMKVDNDSYEIYNKITITNDYLIKNMFDGDYLKYNNENLKPPDINLINLMDQYDCFDINILKICYNIAKRYKKNDDKITDKTFTNIKDTKLLKKIGDTDTNYIGNDIFDIGGTENINGLSRNNNFIIEEFIFTYFLRYYEVIPDKKTITYKSYYDSHKDKLDDYIKKSFVLGNVFKKVVNICFDNKSDFSKYIFSILKTAEDNYMYKDPIIFDNKSYIEVPGINNSNNSSDNKSLSIYNILLIIILIIILIIYGSVVSYTTFFVSILTLSIGIACVFYITKSFKDNDKDNTKRPFQNIKMPSLLTFVYIFIFLFVIIMIISILYMICSFFSESLINGINSFYSKLPVNNATDESKDFDKMDNITQTNIKRLKDNMKKIEKVIEQKEAFGKNKEKL
jgi:hypothetical protein